MVSLLRFFLILLLFPAGLHAQFEQAFETPQPRRIRVLEKMRSDLYAPEDYAAQIKGFIDLKALAEKKDDPQTITYAKAWQATAEARQDTSQLKLYSAQMNTYIRQAKDFHNDILQAQLLIMLVDYVGDVHNHIGAALSYHILADEIMNKLKPDETPRSLPGLKHDLMIHLYDIGDYQRAKEIMDNSKGLEIDLVYQFFYADLHSQILLELHQYDSSAYYISHARALLDADTNGLNRGWYGILEGNLAKIHFYKKEYADAIPQLLKAVAITDEAQINNVTASFGLMLANCFIHVNEIDRILPLLPMIRKAVYAQDRDAYYIDLYKLLLVLQDGKPSPERTLQLLDSIEIRKQSLAKQNDRNLLTKNEMEAELVAYQERQSNMTAEIRQQLILRNLLWTALGCGVLVSFYVFNKRNKRFQLEQNLSRQMQEQTEQELSNARGQLDLFTATLLDKSRQIELLENNIDVSQQNEALEHLRQNTILTEEDWARFKSLFEKAYPGFFARVNHKFPNLTSGEVRFIAFVKLSFTTREMASTLGVSPVSVRSIRSRLLKKLNFAENENLGQLVSDI